MEKGVCHTLWPVADIIPASRVLIGESKILLRVFGSNPLKTSQYFLKGDGDNFFKGHGNTVMILSEAFMQLVCSPVIRLLLLEG